jgi:hypothetical protein
MLVENRTTTERTGAAVGVNALFSKYLRADNKAISSYVQRIPETLSEAVNRLASSTPEHNRDLKSGFGTCPVSDYLLENRLRLARQSLEFHSQAGTLTNRVRERIELLKDRDAEIFVSIHQPNLFAYSGVFKKIVLLQTIKALSERPAGNRKIINLFLIIDHDFMGELWTRVAQLPSIRHSSGVLELRMPVKNSKRWQMLYKMPPPGASTVDQWKKQLILWIRNSSSTLSSSRAQKARLLSNLEQVWEDVEFSRINARSYSDFNSFVISRIVNKIWGYDTIFTRISNISPVFENGFRFLISNFRAYSEALRKAENEFIHHGISTGVSASSYLNAPLWLHCACGSKSPIKIISDRPEEVSLYGKCLGCKEDLRFNVGSLSNPTFTEDTLRNLSPRAIPILLLLSRELGVSCYASGTGGSIGYSIVGSIVFSEFSIPMPLTTIWPSRDLYVGMGQSEALEALQLSNHGEVERYLKTLRERCDSYKKQIIPLVAERSQRVRSGLPIDTTLSDLFKLKESQRELRSLVKIAQKADNALSLNPCFLDYAINFGSRNIEHQWNEKLMNNDTLVTPTVMQI